MPASEVVSGLHVIRLGAVNVHLIDSGDEGLTMIDTGFPKNAPDIEEGLRSIGRDPSDLTNILITHAHPDHLGSAAHFSARSVPVSLPEEEAWIARSGRYDLTMKPRPGLIRGIMFRMMFRGYESYEFPAFEPQRTLRGGQVLSIAGGIEVIPTPGHSTSHVSLLWRRDRNVLFTGDAVVNMPILGYAPGYDDFEAGKRSAVRLADLDFEVAAFGHGKPILDGASAKFAKKFQVRK